MVTRSLNICRLGADMVIVANCIINNSERRRNEINNVDMTCSNAFWILEKPEWRGLKHIGSLGWFLGYIGGFVGSWGPKYNSRCTTTSSSRS
jgi:hypothetical protein